MPTIQEEMSKVLTEWNQPQPTEPQPTKETTMTNHLFNVTNNVTRVTFDYVKANPGVTATQAGNALAPQGFKVSSVSSIMAAMVRNGMCRKEGYKYFVTADEYAPLKPSRVLKKEVAVKDLAPAVQKQVHKERTTITVQSIVENMTMREARELYVELGKYFGA